MSDIFTEVDEDLRRDRAIEFWNKYRQWIIVGVVAILAGTAASIAWRNYQDHQSAFQGKEYHAALRQLSGNDQAGQNNLAQIASSKGAYQKLAEFQLAAKAIETKDMERAFTILSSIAADKADPAAAQLAALQGAYIAVEMKKGNEAEQLLQPLRAEGNAYRALALEASLLNELQRGDINKAKEWLNDLKAISSAPDSPSGLKERLSLIEAELGS